MTLSVEYKAQRDCCVRMFQMFVFFLFISVLGHIQKQVQLESVPLLKTV